MSGLLVLMLVWMGQALWMRVEADKRGMQGWLWAFIGILTPPFGLFFFLFWRIRHPVRPEVAERDEVIEETSRTRKPFYTILNERQSSETDSLIPDNSPETPSIHAALEAEQRIYRTRTSSEDDRE